MTTVIMISSDNSIIINSTHDDSTVYRKKIHAQGREEYFDSGGSSRSNGSTGSNSSAELSGSTSDHRKFYTEKSSISSQDSDILSSGTPDSSFITPRPLHSHRSRLTHRSSVVSTEARTTTRPADSSLYNRDSSLDPLRGIGGGCGNSRDGSLDPLRVNRDGSLDPLRGNRNGSLDPLRGNRNVKETTFSPDSDWEEFNVSSSSAASTLSSRTSGVSSGEVSNLSQDLPETSRPEVDPREDEVNKERLYQQRKVTTLTRPRPQLSQQHRVLRNHSFQILTNHQRFVQSENSAFKVPALPKFLQKESHPNKFLTSTPLREAASYRRSPARQRLSLKGTQYTGGGNSNRLSMNVQSYQYTPADQGKVTVDQRTAGTAAGRAGTRINNNHQPGPLDNTSRSMVRSMDDSDPNYNTRSLGRSWRRGREEETCSTSTYCTLRRVPSHTSTATTEKSSSDLSESSETSPVYQSTPHSLQSYSSEHSVRESRVDLSPINNNYSRIYSQPDLSFGSNNSSYQSVYSTENSRLQPIGSVFPSGCHRHPTRFHRFGNLDSIRLELGPSTSTSTSSSTSYDCSTRRSSSTQTLSNDSGVAKECSETSDIPSISEESDSVYRSKSCDGLSRMRVRQKNPDPSISSISSVSSSSKPETTSSTTTATTTTKKKPLNLSLLGTSKLAGIVGSGSKILRRHTTYIKSSREEIGKNAGHVHSWHKQEDAPRELSTSSLKRNLMRRASSSYRLSQLFKKEDEGDVSVTDAQSLDRLSIQTQEEEEIRPRGRVADWSKDFDNLLSDKYGLYKFTEFLRQEFSHENIYFWCACEKFRLVEDGAERLDAARNIVQRHLASGAIDPVNLDAATGTKLISEPLTGPPPPDLFLSAQNQIYNLMRFDSYPRFLKSGVYTDCVRREMTGTGLHDEAEFTNLGAELPGGHQQQQRMESGGPVLLRHRKHKDREKNRLSIFWDTWGRKEDVSLVSLNSTDLRNTEVDCTLTRVILPNGSTSVVNTTSGESIRALVLRLLEKRGLKLSSFEVYTTSGDKQFDLSEDCDILGCTEVRVEQRISFKLEIPGHRTLAIKTKIYKRIREVLVPLLNQYNWELDNTTILTEEGGLVDLNEDVATVDNRRLTVRAAMSHVVDDLTSSKESTTTTTTAAAGANTSTDPEMSLFEGLQIMRKGRLEDQRGTEISFEIPDFLKLEPSSTHGSVAPNSYSACHNNYSDLETDPRNESSPTLGFV